MYNVKLILHFGIALFLALLFGAGKVSADSDNNYDKNKWADYDRFKLGNHGAFVENKGQIRDQNLKQRPPTPPAPRPRIAPSRDARRTATGARSSPVGAAPCRAPPRPRSLPARSSSATRTSD